MTTTKTKLSLIYSTEDLRDFFFYTDDDDGDEDDDDVFMQNASDCLLSRVSPRSGCLSVFSLSCAAQAAGDAVGAGVRGKADGDSREA